MACGAALRNAVAASHVLSRKRVIRHSRTTVPTAHAQGTACVAGRLAPPRDRRVAYSGVVTHSFRSSTNAVLFVQSLSRFDRVADNAESRQETYR